MSTKKKTPPAKAASAAKGAKPAPKKAALKVAKAPAKKAQKPSPKGKPVPKAASKPAKPVKKPAHKPVVVKKAPPPAKAVAKPSTPKAPAPPAKAVAPKKEDKKVAAPAPVVAKTGTPKGRPPKNTGPVIAVMTGVDPLSGPARLSKRAMKERFQVEFYLRSTPSSLFDLMSTPSGFSEWFCDDVDVRGDDYAFRWGNDIQKAQCIGRRAGEMMRFHWEEDDDPGSFFEMRIRVDDMTNETCLVITDHAWPQDMEDSKALWASQIHTLQRVLGA